MSTFKTYLKERGYATTTIQGAERTAFDFLAWLDGQGMEVEQVQHADILAYVKRKQKQHVQQITIERYLNALKLFYAFKVSTKSIKHNPINNIKIQGIKRKKLYPTFTAEELHGLYNGYVPDMIKCSRGRNEKEHLLIERRNKAMLGLYVYQGVQSSELGKLEVGHVNLRQGSIDVIGTKRSVSRTLQLESHQVLDLYDYVLQVRKDILKISKECTDKLFVSPKGGTDYSNFISAMLRELKRQNPKVQNAQQLRTSVIVKWLGQYNLIEVQKRAGHRYVSSTEGYLANNLDELQDEIIKYHPMG